MDDIAEISRLTSAAFVQALDPMAELLHHCVAAGASVGFVWPFSPLEARRFFADLVPAVAAGKRIILVAKSSAGIVGSMQLDLDVPANQPHRACGRKLLVHTSMRNRGLGTLLMRAMEDEALQAGRTLVDFEAVAGGAPERLYLSLGYTVAGVIPDHALTPDGTLCATSILYKRLSS